MDLTRPVLFRGLFLNGAAGGPGGGNPIDGMRLVRASYPVPAVGYTEKKSLEDGLDASDVWLGGRNLLLQGEVFAANKANLFDALDVLRLKFTATDCYAESPDTRGYLPITFEVPTEHLGHWPTGFVERELRVRPIAQPELDYEFVALGGRTGKGYVVPYVARLQSRDPRFYHPTTVESMLAGGGGSASVVNRGNYPAPVQILLRPDSAAAGTFVFTGMGSSMNVVIPAGGSDRFVRVNAHDKICTLIVGTVETLRMDLVTFNSGTTWPKVPPTPDPTTAAFDWSVSGVGLISPSRLFFNEAWV